MDSSILNSIKTKLGIEPDYDVFDSDIIDYINSTFDSLKRLGVGPEEGFYVIDATDVWDDYKCQVGIGSVKAYMYCKVRMLFDPPTNGTLIDAINKQIAEFEWTLNVEAENNDYNVGKEDDSDD